MPRAKTHPGRDPIRVMRTGVAPYWHFGIYPVVTAEREILRAAVICGILPSLVRVRGIEE